MQYTGIRDQKSVTDRTDLWSLNDHLSARICFPGLLAGHKGY